MKPFIIFSALLALAMAKPASVVVESPNQFSRAVAGDIDDVVITEENLLEGIRTSDRRLMEASAAELRISLVNNFNGGSLNAYISGLDSNGRVVFVTANGGLIYPSSGGSGVPVPVGNNIAIPLPPRGQRLTVTLPIALISGRVYFSEGNLQFFMVNIGGGRDGLVQPSVSNLRDPSVELNWGFVELTLTTAGVIWANISFVDFVGLVFGMSLRSRTGYVQEVRGLTAGAVNNICSALQTQGNIEGRPWAAHCIAGRDGRPIRVLSPNMLAELNSGAFAGYWDGYVNQVWDRYRSTPLRIDTQNGYGIVECRVNGDVLQCNGDNRAYTKPNSRDIWGCNSGPFGIIAGDNAIHYAVVPRLCAAFVRTTLLLEGGNLQPSLGASSYYTRNPTHHYSRIVHQNEVDGKGYAFPYDDVNPYGAPDAAGLVTESNPDSLTFFVGGF